MPDRLLSRFENCQAGEFVAFRDPAAAVLAITVVAAICSVHIDKGLFMNNNGYEYGLALLAASVSLLFSGAGRASLDTVLAGRNPLPGSALFSSTRFSRRSIGDGAFAQSVRLPRRDLSDLDHPSALVAGVELTRALPGPVFLASACPIMRASPSSIGSGACLKS